MIINDLESTFRHNKLKIKHIIETFFIICALYCKIAVQPHDGSEIAILVNLSKLRDSFVNPYGLELVVGAAILCLFYIIDILESSSQRPRWPLIPLSGVFAVLYVYCRSIAELGSGAFLYANAFQLCLATMCILGYWMLFHLALRWALYLLSSVQAQGQENINYKRLWLCSVLIMLVCWLPWIFSSYPASFCSDSLAQLRQYFGHEPWGLNHVPLSTLIMGICVSIGALIKSRSFGVFLYIVMQSFCGAASFSYLLITLRKMGCGKRIYTAGLLFYSLHPLMPSYAQWFEKDFLYVSFFTLAMTLLISTLWEGRCTKKRAICIGLAVVMASLLRNNGKYEIMPFFILLCFAIEKGKRKALISSLVSSLLIVFAVNNIIYPSFSMVEVPAGEMLSIPFQQTARCVKLVPDEVTAEEKAAIAAVLDYDSLAESYKPTLSDPVKRNYHGDSESLKAYIKVWAQMAVKHPSIYLDAFIHQAYGYLAPVEAEAGSILPISQGYYEDFDLLGLSRSADLVPTGVMDSVLTVAHRIPVIKLFMTAGLYSWMVLSCIVFLLSQKCYGGAIPLIPGLINFLACVASAMSGAIRYDLQVVSTMPLLLWWTAINLSKKK